MTTYTCHDCGLEHRAGELGEIEKRLRSLSREARECAKSRGHDMAHFERQRGSHSMYAECKACKMNVTIEARPAPNSAPIHGEAVALNCGDQS